MSIPVDLTALRAEVTRFGPSALLVTTSPEGHPHVASVLVTFEDDALTMGAGRGTRANAARQPVVTLVCPTGPDGAYCLIVDGTAGEGAAPSENLVVCPTSAVLHRLATASDRLPSCIRFDQSTA